eukprot:502848_1
MAKFGLCCCVTTLCLLSLSLISVYYFYDEHMHVIDMYRHQNYQNNTKILNGSKNYQNNTKILNRFKNYQNAQTDTVIPHNHTKVLVVLLDTRYNFESFDRTVNWTMFNDWHYRNKYYYLISFVINYLYTLKFSIDFKITRIDNMNQCITKYTNITQHISPRKICWCKMDIIEYYMKQNIYKWIIHFDSDVIFTNLSLSFDHFLSLQNGINTNTNLLMLDNKFTYEHQEKMNAIYRVFIQDIAQNRNTNAFYMNMAKMKVFDCGQYSNAGLLIFKNSTISLKILNDWESTIQYVPNILRGPAYWAEQTAFNCMVYPFYKENIKIFSNVINDKNSMLTGGNFNINATYKGYLHHFWGRSYRYDALFKILMKYLGKNEMQTIQMIRDIVTNKSLIMTWNKTQIIYYRMNWTEYSIV